MTVATSSMKFSLLRSAAGAVCAAALASGCAMRPGTLQTATGDTAPAPAVVAVAVTDPALADGCWAQLYTERNFRGEMATLAGPAMLEAADNFSARKLKRAIDSVVVGPKATLTMYKTSMFRDRAVAFGPNTRQGGVLAELGVGGAIESMKLECTS